MPLAGHRLAPVHLSTLISRQSPIAPFGMTVAARIRAACSHYPFVDISNPSQSQMDPCAVAFTYFGATLCTSFCTTVSPCIRDDPYIRVLPSASLLLRSQTDQFTASDSLIDFYAGDLAFFHMLRSFRLLLLTFVLLLRIAPS